MCLRRVGCRLCRRGTRIQGQRFLRAASRFCFLAPLFCRWAMRAVDARALVCCAFVCISCVFNFVSPPADGGLGEVAHGDLGHGGSVQDSSPANPHAAERPNQVSFPGETVTIAARTTPPSSFSQRLH